jgi:hypothetical protein
MLDGRQPLPRARGIDLHPRRVGPGGNRRYRLAEVELLFPYEQVPGSKFKVQGREETV